VKDIARGRSLEKSKKGNQPSKKKPRNPPEKDIVGASKEIRKPEERCNGKLATCGEGTARGGEEKSGEKKKESAS